MAEEKEGKATPEEDAPAPPPKSKLVLVLVVTNLVVVLAAAGGAVAFVTLGAGSTSAAQESSSEESGEAREMGPLLEVSDIVVNLDDESGRRFVRAGFQFELADADRQSEVEAHLVPVRSAFLLHLSGLTAEQTLGQEAREALLERLREIANEQIGAELVTHIYFTAFVVQ